MPHSMTVLAMCYFTCYTCDICHATFYDCVSYKLYVIPHVIRVIYVMSHSMTVLAICYSTCYTCDICHATFYDCVSYVLFHMLYV